MIPDLIAAYDAVSDAGDFFSQSKRNLNNLLQRKKENLVRIAIIGITSSGKSTLLNAILGDSLLPTGVAPSSGVQVGCAYDKKSHADIIFTEESRKKRLVVTKNIAKEIQGYGDERNNPGNKKQVREIQIFSSRFQFDRNLVFVDTPGLDAYQLDVHEEITLKQVVPSVDIIVYI